MKRKNQPISDSNRRDFEIMYNAMSLGWHLRRIAEINNEILNDEENKDRFEKWLKRHLKIEL